MANEPEHRMLFDLRGKRKRVVQVAYVGLALIMVLSLFTVVGPLNPLDILGNGSTSNSSAAESLENQAHRIEKRLKKEPNNARLQGELVRIRSSAGNSLVSIDSSTGQQTVTEEATAQYDLAAQAWDKYLKMVNGKPDPSIAQLAATTLFTLSQGSTVAQFEKNIADAAEAQALLVASENPPEVGTLTTLATYQYYAQQFDKAAATRKRAMAAADTKIERNQVKAQLDATEKDARRIGKEIKRINKSSKGQGKQELQDPLGSLGSSGVTTTP